MKTNKNIYFISDVHLGVDSDCTESIKREKLLLNFLEDIRDSAQEIYLLGDIFDFWFEYRNTVPKGFTRFLGKIAEFTDAGIAVNFFKGNHDMWTFGYLEGETGMKVFDNSLHKEINGKTFYISHGDGLGPYDKTYNILKKVFRNRILQFLFKLIHPDFGIFLAKKWSSSSRKKHKYSDVINYEDEWLVRYSRSVLENTDVDFFIFGHRHIPFQYKLNDKSTFTNIGDWLKSYSYAVFDGERLELKIWDKNC